MKKNYRYFDNLPRSIIHAWNIAVYVVFNEEQECFIRYKTQGDRHWADSYKSDEAWTASVLNGLKNDQLMSLLAK
jgi:hypothetical protein